jgi:SMODS-associating 2TM, beta-strand rich effector domain
VISVLPITRLVGLIAVAYGVCVAAIVAIEWQFSEATSLKSSIGVALSGATVLNLLLLFLIYVGWKRIWTMIPALNRWVFPDLSGEWKMAIHWQGVGKRGIKSARAQITQDLLRISMEVFSEDSDSETLIVHPKRDPESGRPILYYVYRVTPKMKEPDAGGSYEGSAILKLSGGRTDRWGGNYFTSRQTLGHFELSR